MMAPVRTLGGTERAASLCHRCGVSRKKASWPLLLAARVSVCPAPTFSPPAAQPYKALLLFGVVCKKNNGLAELNAKGKGKGVSQSGTVSCITVTSGQYLEADLIRCNAGGQNTWTSHDSAPSLHTHPHTESIRIVYEISEKA
ncbi:unnamed protein product [Arctogadus glacialis]